MGNDCTCLTNIEDVLCFLPSETDLNHFLQELNKVDAAIQFTTEEENNDKILFLDTVILKDGEKIQLTVHRKTTNKTI